MSSILAESLGTGDGTRDRDWAGKRLTPFLSSLLFRLGLESILRGDAWSGVRALPAAAGSIRIGSIG